MTPLPNGPIAPPTLQSTVPYSTVVLEASEIGALHSINGPSNEEYTRFNHNVHASTQLHDQAQHPSTSTSHVTASVLLILYYYDSLFINVMFMKINY